MEMPEHLWYYYTPKGLPYGKFDWLIGWLKNRKILLNKGEQQPL